MQRNISEGMFLNHFLGHMYNIAQFIHIQGIVFHIRMKNDSLVIISFFVSLYVSEFALDT